MDLPAIRSERHTGSSYDRRKRNCGLPSGYGSDFHNTLKIENHTATIISANCRDQLCVYHKSISSPGESIICLPHKLSITIIGGNESVPDGISG